MRHVEFYFGKRYFQDRRWTGGCWTDDGFRLFVGRYVFEVSIR